MTKKIPIVELFGRTIQGEGALAGQVSFFLRTGNCQFRCSWCDSMHAVDPKQVRRNAKYMTPEEIVLAVEKLSGSAMRKDYRDWVTLTGGDPVLWDLTQVVSGLYFSGFRCAVETQGALWKDWLEHCDLVTVSPKPPSSGMADKLDVVILQKYRARLGNRLVAKVVVFDDEDLEFAARIRRILPGVPFYLSAGTPKRLLPSTLKLDVCQSFRWLAEKVCADTRFHDAIVLPQLHVLAWGEDLGR